MLKVRRLSLFFTVMVLLVALAVNVTSAQGTVIRIASQSPLSGPQSVLGTSIRNAVELAILQNSGTLQEMGFTIEYVPFDDQATPDVGVANAQNLVNDPAILAVIGHLNSGVAIAASEVYNANNLVMVSPANTNPQITERYLPTVNRICGRDDTQGRAGAAFASSLEGVQTVYVLHDTTAYGQGLAEFFRAAAPEYGLEVLGFEGTTEQSNFDGIVQPILALSPDLVYFGGIYSQTGIFIAQARAAGYTGYYMGGDGFDSSEFAQLAGDAGVGTYYTSVTGPVSIYPDAAQFAADYAERYGGSPQPFAAQAYDATVLTIRALEKAVARTGAAPSRALVASIVRDTQDFQGITSSYTFDAIGDPEIGLYYVLQVGSANVDEWNNNELLQSLQIPSPLKAAIDSMSMGQ